MKIINVIFLLLAMHAAAQQDAGSRVDNGQTSENAGIIRVRSQLVVLDTVVRDSHGQLVKGLAADDFVVYDNDQPQKLVSFDAVDLNMMKTASHAVHSSSDLEKGEVNQPVTILVLDEINSQFEDEYFARYSLERYLKTQPDTLREPTILLARNYARTLELQDYTTSKSAILDALHRHFVGNDWRSKDPGQVENLFGATLASLVEIAKASEGHRGHKNVIWIGRGFPSVSWDAPNGGATDAMMSTVMACSNLLRRDRITLYALDPSGISSAVENTLDANGQIAPTNPLETSFDFDTLAKTTGGVAMHGRNDVDRMIGEAVGAGESFYTLTYRPSTAADEDPKQFHTIRIVVKQPGLQASSRQGYYQGDGPGVDVSGKGDVAHARELDLAGAINSLMVYTGIPLELQRKPQNDQVEVRFPAAALHVTEADGQMTGEVELLLLTYNRNGKRVAESGKVFTLHLHPSGNTAEADRTISIVATLPPASDPARVRIVLRDRQSGSLGAENLFLIDRNQLKDAATGERAAKSGGSR